MSYETKENEGIRILEINYLGGPNVHALYPVMEAQIDLGKWVDTLSNPKIAKELSSLLPGLNLHIRLFNDPLRESYFPFI